MLDNSKLLSIAFAVSIKYFAVQVFTEQFLSKSTGGAGGGSNGGKSSKLDLLILFVLFYYQFKFVHLSSA